MAALNGYFDCVQLLLDLNANASAATYHYGTSMDLIGKSFVEDDDKYAFFFSSLLPENYRFAMH